MTPVSAGRFFFELEYRRVSGDQGLTLHVYGPSASDAEADLESNEEVLRFDCFDNEPHYHLAWSARNDPFIRISEPDPFRWTLNQLQHHIADLLSDASAAPIMPDELEQMPQVLAALSAQAEQLDASSKAP